VGVLSMIDRRSFLAGAGVSLLCAPELIRAARAQSPPATLLSAPIELGGEWYGSPQTSVALVLARTRDVALSGVRLLSDRQPEQLRVDDHATGPPFVWLHSDPPREAWIIVDVGARDWCKLAYQFGHELGHVLCNSWQLDAKPRPPCQWLEETIVEAFSIRGLGLLAESWEEDPPYAGTNDFGQAIRRYRALVIDGYRRPDDPAPGADIAPWFAEMRDEVAGKSLDQIEGPAILAILEMLEGDKRCVEDMGALNRWPERSALPLEPYLKAWTASCSEIAAPGRLPAQIKSRLGLGL
jgi:hypothetical protein